MQGTGVGFLFVFKALVFLFFGGGRWWDSDTTSVCVSGSEERREHVVVFSCVISQALLCHVQETYRMEEAQRREARANK